MPTYHSYVYKIDLDPNWFGFGQFWYIGSRFCGEKLPHEDEYDGSPVTFKYAWDKLPYKKTILKTFSGRNREAVKDKALKCETRYLRSRNALNSTRSLNAHIERRFAGRPRVNATKRLLDWHIRTRFIKMIFTYGIIIGGVLIFVFFMDKDLKDGHHSGNNTNSYVNSKLLG